MIVLIAIFTLIGYLIGTKAVLLLQLGVIVSAILYNKHQKSFPEIGAVIPMICTFWLFVGMVVGNIVFAIVNPDKVAASELLRGVAWLFTPK